MNTLPQKLIQSADSIQQGSLLLREALHYSNGVEEIVLLDLIRQTHQLEAGIRQLHEAIDSTQPRKP